MANYQTYKQIQGDQALIANSVGPGQVTGVSTGVAHQFFLYNNNYWSVSNGGCCLNWTVPPLTTSVRFELTSGGGTGSIGACCSNGPSGGAGAYATKTLFAYRTLLLVLPHIPFVLEEHHSVLAADSVQVEHVVVEEVAQVM